MSQQEETQPREQHQPIEELSVGSTVGREAPPRPHLLTRRRVIAAILGSGVALGGGALAANVLGIIQIVGCNAAACY